MGTTGQSITLANSIIGVGILAMPFCFQQCGVLLATLILLFMGLISRLCCYFLLKSALLARRRNFEFLAFHVFGSAGKMAVELGIIGFLMGTCIAYFVVVGDLGPQIISKMFNINQSDILRTSIMVIVSLVCVLPLGLLRNVDSLSNVSAATIGFYFCLVIKVIAEAAAQLPSGDWQRRMELWKPQGLLQCVPIFSMALFCQTQLFEIFESLPSLSLEKMNVVTKTAINICTCVYFTLGLFGYIAFCSQDISGNILMSLSPTMASDVIKLGFVMSLAFSFPLIIFPCRASIYSFLYKKVHSSQHDHIVNHSIPAATFRCITAGIIAVALFISLLIPNIELVLGLVGSTIGVLVCVVFPAACFIHVTFKNTNERVLAKGVLILGLVIMVLGTYANLQAAETQIERYDERFITQEKIDQIVEDFFEKRKIAKDSIKADPIAIDASMLNGNMKKDSEIQPPNPVPPESNSNELRNPESNNVNKLGFVKINDDKLADDLLSAEKIKVEVADAISGTHPKNLKNKLVDAKLAIEEIDSADKIEEKPKPANDESKVEKIKLMKQEKLIETMKQHGEEQRELMQEQKEILDEIIKNKKEINIEKPIEPKPSNVEKSDENNKHQQLIETIKQHGQEQKELMKEQKEILDEIKELKQNKDTDSNEAKKIAVESIKQIADIAIKSIGGVTEKPVRQPKEDIKADRLEKLTHEAVQEIAKKAVETIEAIQEIKEKPDLLKSANVINDKVENVKPQASPPVIPKKAELKQNAEVPIRNLDLQNNQNANNIVQGYVKPEIPKPNLNSQPKNVDNINQANVKRDLQNNIAPDLQTNNEIKHITNIEKIISKIPAQANNVAVKQNLEKVETKNVAPIDNSVAGNENLNDIKVKLHSHSPDEPQSYIVGEDTQIQHEGKKLDQNIPIAVAMSDQAKLESTANKEILAKLNNIPEIKPNIDYNNIAKESIPKIDNLVRQKREILDCKQQTSLEPVNKILCKIQAPNSIDLLPKVDLNDRLSIFPLDADMLHIGRSLKNYDETDKKR